MLSYSTRAFKLVKTWSPLRMIYRNCHSESTLKQEFTHISSASNQPRMVNVTQKTITSRTATARSIVSLPPATAKLLMQNEIHTKKGPVFATAIVAGTMACKRTPDLIPFCHPLHINQCDIDITTITDDKDQVTVQILATVGAIDKTGVEMEALTTASVAALTIYDMCKSVAGPEGLVIQETRLLSKTGGKTDLSL